MKAIEHLGNHILFTIQLKYILVINKIRAVDAREQFSKISSFVEAVQSGVQKDHTDIYYEYAPQVSYYDTRINLPFKNKKFYKALIFAKLFRIFAHFKNERLRSPIGGSRFLNMSVLLLFNIGLFTTVFI